MNRLASQVSQRNGLRRWGWQAEISWDFWQQVEKGVRGLIIWNSTQTDKSHLRSSLGQSFLCDVIHTFPKEVTIPGQMFKQLADKVRWNENPCWDVNSYLSLCQEH